MKNLLLEEGDIIDVQNANLQVVRSTGTSSFSPPYAWLHFDSLRLHAFDSLHLHAFHPFFFIPCQATFSKFQPQSVEFLDISNPKAV